MAALALIIFASAFQLINTRLNITVRDDLGNIVSGASVQLFETEDDYNKEQNVAAQSVTDDKGKVSIKDLKAIPYFVIIRKGDKDNSGGGEQTAKLEENKINRVTIIIQ
jgi:uncharacterized protein (DUF2141 family)